MPYEAESESLQWNCHYGVTPSSFHVLSPCPTPRTARTLRPPTTKTWRLKTSFIKFCGWRIPVLYFFVSYHCELHADLCERIKQYLNWEELNISRLCFPHGCTQLECGILHKIACPCCVDSLLHEDQVPACNRFSRFLGLKQKRPLRSKLGELLLLSASQKL